MNCKVQPKRTGLKSDKFCAHKINEALNFFVIMFRQIALRVCPTWLENKLMFLYFRGMFYIFARLHLTSLCCSYVCTLLCVYCNHQYQYFALHIIFFNLFYRFFYLTSKYLINIFKFIKVYQINHVHPSKSCMCIHFINYLFVIFQQRVLLSTADRIV